MTTEETLNEIIKLYVDYKEDIGISEGELEEYGSDPKAHDNFEAAMNDLICQHKGHHMIRDHCGMPHHDFCIMCVKSREMLGDSAPALA